MTLDIDIPVKCFRKSSANEVTPNSKAILKNSSLVNEAHFGFLT